MDDARAAMELVLLKIKNGPLWGSGHQRSGDKLAAVLAQHGHRSCFVGRCGTIRRHMAPNSSGISAQDDDEAVRQQVVLGIMPRTSQELSSRSPGTNDPVGSLGCKGGSRFASSAPKVCKNKTKNLESRGNCFLKMLTPTGLQVERAVKQLDNT